MIVKDLMGVSKMIGDVYEGILRFEDLIFRLKDKDLIDFVKIKL